MTLLIILKEKYMYNYYPFYNLKIISYFVSFFTWISSYMNQVSFFIWIHSNYFLYQLSVLIYSAVLSFAFLYIYIYHSNKYDKCKLYKTLTLQLLHNCMRWRVNRLSKSYVEFISRWCFHVISDSDRKKKKKTSYAKNLSRLNQFCVECKV